MMKKPHAIMRFSILIPVYNVERFLTKCMKSVLDQSFQDFEVILVDDGSTDNSGMLCDKYKNENIRVIHQNNQGLLMARRAAIALAKGEFCIFLDSDDYLQPQALENINNKLVDTRADILIYNTVLVYDDTNIPPIERKPVFTSDKLFVGEDMKKELYDKLLYGGMLNNLVLKAIRTELVQSDDTDYLPLRHNSMGEDLLQSLYPITHANRVAYTPECYYCYRQVQSSMTHSIDPSKLERRFAMYNPVALEYRIKYAKIWGVWDEEHMYGIYKHSIQVVRTLFDSVFSFCKDSTVRKRWCSFSWNELLPDEVMERRKDPRLGLGIVARVHVDAIMNNRYWMLVALAVIKKCIRKR